MMSHGASLRPALQLDVTRGSASHRNSTDLNMPETAYVVFKNPDGKYFCGYDRAGEPQFSAETFRAFPAPAMDSEMIFSIVKRHRFLLDCTIIDLQVTFGEIEQRLLIDFMPVKKATGEANNSPCCSAVHRALP